MGVPYIPTREADALQWMKNFAAQLSAAPATYQVSGPDAANISAAVAAFEAAYDAAKEPSGQNPVTIVTKDETRRVAEELCRQFAILIKYNAGITSADKIEAGIRPVNTSRQPIHVPATSPLLNIVGATPGSQTLKFRDAMNPEARGKPFGAETIQIFVAVGETEGPVEGARFLGAYKRNPIGVAFTEVEDGKIATYYARWAGGNGDTGPWSNPVTMRIAA